jgi:hypothetical protein
MSFEYITPSYVVRKIGVPMDADRFAAAIRSKDAARPAPARPKREAMDGSPCFNCGASGYAGCAHQIAAPRPVVGARDDKPEAQFGLAKSHKPGAFASPDDCAAFLGELQAFIADYPMTHVERRKHLGAQQPAIEAF